MSCPHPFRPALLAGRGRALLALLVLSFLLAGLAGCREGEDRSSQPAASGPKGMAVTLCHGSLNDLLPRIALEMGYFHAEGLELTLKDMGDGRQAFDDMRQGACNFAVCAAPPIALHDPAQADFLILATVMADDDAARIIARRDHGIVKPQDLRGKRIGVKRGIVGHLFLDMFMMKYGLAQQDITLVELAPNDLPQALADGRIDGFAMTDKLTNASAKTLGERAIVFSEPGLNIIYGILTAHPDPATQAAIPALLAALLRAERYTRAEPAGAKAIIAKAYGLSASELEAIWARTGIEVALANSLFVNLEDQYRWQVDRGFVPAFASFPNYLTVVMPDYLRAIKPEAVSVVKQ